MVCAAKHLVTLWRPLWQMTRGNAGFQDSGVLGDLRAGSSVLLVRCKSTSSSPYKGLLGWDRSWGFESQVRLLNSECHLSAYPSFGPAQFIPDLKNQLKPRRCICPSADTTCPVTVAIAKGGVSNTWWLVSMGIMLLLAQWYYNHAQLQCETM